MTPCLFIRHSIYCFGIWLLLNIYFCEWIICGASNDTVFRPMQPDELQAFLTELAEKNSTQWYKCPAPKLPIKDVECKAKRCHNDEDCNNQICCFNGCVFTCVQQMASPAVIDWVEEPEVDSVFSSETVENGNETASSEVFVDTKMRPCTMTAKPAPSLPVGCPPGYRCRIENLGDPLEVPSNGVCVPDIHKERDLFDDDDLFKEQIGKDTVYLPGGCVLTAEQYDQMKKFMLRSYVVDCFCNKGSVECKVTL